MSAGGSGLSWGMDGDFCKPVPSTPLLGRVSSCEIKAPTLFSPAALSLFCWKVEIKFLQCYSSRQTFSQWRCGMLRLSPPEFPSYKELQRLGALLVNNEAAGSDRVPRTGLKWRTTSSNNKKWSPPPPSICSGLCRLSRPPTLIGRLIGVSVWDP